MNNIDIALLLSETAEHGERCPSCHQVVPDLGHRQVPPCPHDLALDERGYFEKVERDAARSRIRAGNEPTIPPPLGEGLACGGCGRPGFGPDVQSGAGAALHWELHGVLVCIDCYKARKP